MYPFNDRRIRRAILKAINISKFVHNSSRGKAIVAKGPLPPNYFKYEEKEQETYDIAEALRILKNLGITEMNVKFDFPSIVFARNTKIELLKHDLKNVGIILNTKGHDSWDEFNRILCNDSTQMFYYGGASDIIGDPLNFLFGFFYSSSIFNALNYNNPLVDKLIDEAFLEHNSAKRQLLYHNIVNKILLDRVF